MTYAVHHPDFTVQPKAATKAGARATAILRRVFGAIFQSHEEQRDAAIAAFLARSGGRLTDDLERQIERRETASNWSVDL
jgi:hypothetical protein